MNKLFTNIMGAFLGLTMVACVGSAIGVNGLKAEPIKVDASVNSPSNNGIHLDEAPTNDSPSITINAPTDHIIEGNTGTLTAVTANATNPVITWSSDNNSILLVGSDGFYQARTYGVVTVTASMTCVESTTPIVDTCEVIIDGYSSISIDMANQIASALSIGETTKYRINVQGGIGDLDPTGLKDSIEVVALYGEVPPSINVYGIFEDSPVREYAIVYAHVNVSGCLQRTETINQIVNPEINSYYDGAILYSEYWHERFENQYQDCSITEDEWAEAEEAFTDLLDNYAKARLQTATTDDVISEVATWVGHYDLIISKLHYNNFMAREIENVNLHINYVNNQTEDSIALIVIITVVGLTAIGAFFFIRRRKQYN